MVYSVWQMESIDHLPFTINQPALSILSEDKSQHQIVKDFIKN